MRLAYGEQLLIFGCIPDDLAAEFAAAYDPDDEAHIRHAIRCVIVPYFRRWDPPSQAEARKVWAEVLANREEEWMLGAWEADLPPIDLPRKPRRFAKILWDELWPGDNPRKFVTRGSEIDPDPLACNDMRVAPADGPEIDPDLLNLPGRAT